MRSDNGTNLMHDNFHARERNVDFFNELGKHCELTVIFESNSATARDDVWKQYLVTNFRAVILKGIKHGNAEAFCPSVIHHLRRKKYDKIVVTNYANPTGILAVAVLKMLRIPYIIEGDGAFAGTSKGIKERLKRWLLSGADLCFSTAQEHDKYYRTYGVLDDRIVRYPFTSLSDQDVLSRPVSPEEKAALRKKLGIKEDKVLLSVGQFIHRKGYDILFDALSKMDRDVSCYIVGGQPTEEYLRQVEALGLDNVHFVDFKPKADLSEYYMAADLFVLPTREDIWGLVINEAMAKGLPVVTTDRCIAGLELITKPELGEIVPVENAKALEQAIVRTLATDKNRQAILETIRQYTIENMARKHMEIWELS